MTDFLAGVIIGAVIMGFVCFQIGWVRGRKSALDDVKKGRRA